MSKRASREEQTLVDLYCISWPRHRVEFSDLHLLGKHGQVQLGSVSWDCREPGAFWPTVHQGREEGPGWRWGREGRLAARSCEERMRDRRMIQQNAEEGRIQTKSIVNRNRSLNIRIDRSCYHARFHGTNSWAFCHYDLDKRILASTDGTINRADCIPAFMSMLRHTCTAG